MSESSCCGCVCGLRIGIVKLGEAGDRIRPGDEGLGLGK